MQLNIFSFLLIFVSACQGLNILVIFPHIGKSHYLVFQPLLKKLASTGHNLSVISFFPQKEKIPNFRDVTLDIGEMGGEGLMDMGKLKLSRLELYGGPNLLAYFSEISCPKTLESPNLHMFLEEQNKFDVVLMEYFQSNCALGIVKKFDAPVIGLSTCINPPWVNTMLGSPNNPSYIPSLFLDHSDKMTFFERVENAIYLLYTKWIYKYWLAKRGNILSKQYMKEDILEGGDMMYNVSLLLSNTHYSFSRPKPLTPNVIEVAGIHIEEPNVLPEVFQTFLDESKYGVIYMSMGSMLQGTSLPIDKRKRFQNVFAKLPQRIIWKWENESMPNQPSNVMVTKWAPQREVLCHPNVRAFISHGGLLGTLEAVHCGVPIIVIPQFGDQHINAKLIEAAGSGVIMKLSEATEETISNNIKRVLSAEVRRNAKDLSERFRDRPHSPMDTAIYWIDYVAKFKGAKFMRSVATDMPFYQLYLLDVIFFVAVTISLVLFICYRIVKITLRNVMGKTKLKSS